LRQPAKSAASFFAQTISLGDKVKQHSYLVLFLLVLIPEIFAVAQTVPLAQNSSSQWELTWSDEFNGKDGSLPDPARWTVVIDGTGFGNRELEYYTNHSENLHIENGNLVITAKAEHFVGPKGDAHEFTSGRIQTAKHFEQKYGRFEARIKLPPGGQGIWPAFWMLGNDIEEVGWPKCGEIDIMENIGAEPGKVHGSLHGPRYSGDSPLTGAFQLPNGRKFSDDYHVFAVEWEPAAIRFYVDDVLFETQTPDNIPSSKHWAFDHPFFLLLNVAVGGAWPGNPDASTVLPTPMLVDYVRVYRNKAR
jgi:beta-glucanase (GH16 family)